MNTIHGISSLQFCLSCLKKVNTQQNAGRYPSWSNETLGLWGEIGLNVFQQAVTSLSPTDQDIIKKEILSLVSKDVKQPTRCTTAEMEGFDKALAWCITASKDMLEEQQFKILLERGWWHSVDACIQKNPSLRSMPWQVLWSLQPLSTFYLSKSETTQQINKTQQEVLDRVDALLAQDHLSKEFMPFIPLDRFKNLIKNKKLDAEKLLEVIEKDPNIPVGPSHAYSVVEKCIDVWDQQDPTKTKQKVSKWREAAPRLANAAQLVPTAYVWESETPFAGWHCALLENWGALMTDYNGRKRIQIASHFKNNTIVQGDMTMLCLYMNMAQIRPTRLILKKASGTEGFWSSAQSLQALNENEASRISFWVSCARPQFFNFSSQKVKEEITKQIERLAFAPKEYWTKNLSSLKPFVAGSYQYITHRKEKLSNQEAKQAWDFLNLFPQSLNQEPVITKVIEAIKNNVFSPTDDEISHYRLFAHLSEKMDLSLSVALASAKSQSRTKMKM